MTDYRELEQIGERDKALREEKKPCPHCGAEPTADHIPAHDHLFVGLALAGDTWTIECRCGAGMIGNKSEAELLERWNRRSP
jgi:hypothetical protein